MSTGGRGPTDRTLRRFAWLAFAFTVAVVVAGLAFRLLGWDVPRPEGVELAPALTLAFDQVDYLVSAVLALAITSRRPRNVIGWLIVSASVGLALWDGAEAYARWSLAEHDGRLPGTVVVAWLTTWVWALTVVIPIYLFLLYPDGRLPSPRWRWVLRAAVAHTVVMIALLVLTPGRLDVFPELENPFGVRWLPEVTPDGSAAHFEVLFVIMTLLTVIGFVSLLFRYRSAGMVERRQIRWLLFAGVIFVLVQAVGFDLLPFVLAELLTTLASIGFTAAVAVAVLRYRLYEIDRIISRTATYAAVTVVVVAVYATVVVLPTAVFALESDLLVAAATLAAAAVFVPVRRRVQLIVDRRFNRARYDAHRVVERFGGRLRDDVDLDSLARDVSELVGTTMQPTHVSLWLRTRGAAR